MESHRRITLSDQMKASSSGNSLASFLNQKTRNQTLLDVIQQEQRNNNATMKDRNSWKAFKDMMLRLKRRNSAHQQQPEVLENSPVNMSLMDLLEETEVDLDPRSEDDEYRNVEQVGDGGGVVVKEYNCCCVCMVRHKGAAFIPCGHTFCRMCSRELWVSRGNCPLCNHFISEILDIF